MAAAPLGHKVCPLCGGQARLSLMKTGLACLTMDCCNAQLMARSGKSDERLRDLPTATPKPGKAEQPTKPAEPSVSINAPADQLAEKGERVRGWATW